MSKKQQNVSPKYIPPRIVELTGVNPVFYKDGWGNALLVQEGTGSVLVGKLLTIIDSLGLPERQERAVKDVIRNEVYDSYDNAWIIGEEDNANLREKAFKFGQLSVGGNLPPSFPTCAVAGTARGSGYASGPNPNSPNAPTGN